MATSIKLSELQSLANLTLTDLLLVTDAETSTSRKITFQNLRDSFNLTEIPGYDAYNTQVVTLVSDETTARETAVAALQDLVDTLTTEAQARNTRITTLETTVDNLDIDIAPETLNSINELAAAMGDDPQMITNVQTKSDQNEAEISALRSVTGTNSGTTFLGSFNGGILPSGISIYAALYQLESVVAANQTSIDNLDIDIAPETLNSINELAAAMGDDPTFLTTLQARVTTIENDNATQTELDAYKAEIEDRNLQLALAYDTPLYVDTLFGG